MPGHMLLSALSSLPRPAAFVAFAALVGGCGVPPPDRLEIQPATPIKSTEQGAQTKLKVAAWRGVTDYDDSKAPLVVSWSSSNTAIADVSADGTVTSTGSGKAQIKATVAGNKGQPVEATVDVNNVMVSAVEASGAFPAKFKLSSAPVTLKVLVKDEKGQIIDRPRLTFRATDYCVEVSADGVVAPLAVGECAVVVESAGKRISIPLDVLE